MRHAVLRGGRGLGRYSVGLLAVLLATTGAAESGGVALLESGGRRMGSAFAGGAAEADDATTIWWNPAGMSRLRRHSAVGVVHLISPSTKFSDQGSRDVGGMPISGGNEDGGVDAVVPSVYAAFRLNRRWHVGLSVNTPFGLSTDYGDTWVGRYYATESELVTFNISAAASYRVNRRWSIGAGVNAMYADATLKSRVDFGAFAAMPQAFDGSADITGDDWSLGWNLGVLFQPTCCTRFGLHYRSRVKHEIDGTGKFVVPAAVAGGLPAGLFTNSDAEAEIELPDSLSFSAYHRLNCCLAVMGDLTWTHWRLFDELIVDYENPVQPNTVLDLDWTNTVRLSVGAVWTPNARWELRGGLLYDRTPVPMKTRTPRIPDADRFWVTLGVGYRINRRMRVDASFAHIFGSDVNTRQSSATQGTLRGSYDASADILGLQFTIDF